MTSRSSSWRTDPPTPRPTWSADVHRCGSSRGRAPPSRALNAGDAAASHFPRAYVDADVQVKASAVIAARALDKAGALGGAPALRIDFTGALGRCGSSTASGSGWHGAR